MNSSSMHKCGLCATLRDMARRAFCIASRRGSTESYYREIGDQETLKIEDRSSDLSDETEDMNQETFVVPELHAEPESSPESETPDDIVDLSDMPLRNNPLGKFRTLHRRRRKLHADDAPVEPTGQLDHMYQSQVQGVLAQSTQWKFNAFTLETVSGGRGLPVLCMHLFHTYGLMHHFKLEPASMWKLFILIQDNYHANNPYHNSTHAADVTQAMHCFLHQPQIRKHLKPLDILTALLSAITHDVDHPGVNQPFLVGTSNHLANLYGNTSVLENHHWRIAVSCLMESCAFDHVPGLMPILKKELKSMILATDITKQQNYLAKFKHYMDMNRIDMRTSEHRHLVLQIALKCADISNPCRPWDISRMWSLKVCEEFFRQGDYERQLDVPVSLICDRHSTSIPKIQTTFFKFVVIPLIKSWHKFLKNGLSKGMLDNLLYNLNKWETLVVYETTGETEDTRLERFNAYVARENTASRSAADMSESTETLLPPRRSSLNPAKQSTFKDQLRRFSVPMSVFQEAKYKNKERVTSMTDSSIASTPTGPQPSTSQKILSLEHLIPESSITSLTTPVLATRLKTVLKEKRTGKSGRKQTVPPNESESKAQVTVHAPPKINEGASSSKSFKIDLAEIINIGKSKCGKSTGAIKKKNKRTIQMIAETTDGETLTVGKNNENSLSKGASGRRGSTIVGSQLRENLVSIQLGALETDQFLQRRKSMPAEVVAIKLKEKMILEVPAATPREVQAATPCEVPAATPCEVPAAITNEVPAATPSELPAATPSELPTATPRAVPAVIPQFLHQALSTKSWTQRRGSAPAPVAPSELRGLAGSGPMTHSVSGGRKKLSPIGSLQQWHPKTTCNVQENTYAYLPRRSSLPVEVMTGISSY